MTEAGGPDALRTWQVVKRYGEAVALGPLDLQVRAGEMVAVLGPNGAGKSTLLALAAGLLEPSAGARFRRAAGELGRPLDGVLRSRHAYALRRSQHRRDG